MLTSDGNSRRVFGLALLGAFAAVSSRASEIAGQITGLVQPLIESIPPRIPIKSTVLPSVPPPPDFPTFVLDWRSFEVTGSEILGTGTTTIVARDQSMVAMSIDGAKHILGYQEDLAGGAGQTYGFTLANLAPDPDKFKWQVSGTGSTAGPIERGPFDQGGSLGVVFPLPLDVKPGTYPFDLAVTATETCGTDPRKTLNASSSTGVSVEVKENPVVSP
jgi:hypothetical protein